MNLGITNYCKGCITLQENNSIIYQKCRIIASLWLNLLQNVFWVYFSSNNTLDSSIIFRKNDIQKEFQFHNSFHETWNIASSTPAHHCLSVRMKTLE